MTGKRSRSIESKTKHEKKNKKSRFEKKSKPVKKIKNKRITANDKDDQLKNNSHNECYEVCEDDPIFHFTGNLNQEEVDQLDNIENWSREEFHYEYLGRSFVETPENVDIKQRTLPPDEMNPMPQYLFPTPRVGNFSDLTSPFDVSKHVKDHLVSRIPESNGFNSSDDVGLTPLQNDILSVIGRYADLYYTEAKLEHLEEIRFVYCLHIINHLFKCRSQIVYNNEILEENMEKLVMNVDLYKDVGFTRAKVLILAPFKNTAYKIVHTIIKILGEKKNGRDIRNLKRFEEDYGPLLEVKPDRLNRPDDYHATFEGNKDDNFKIGIKLSKGSLKLYSEFRHSDIIIASPLGATLCFGSKKTKDFNVDFLNSIEISILDQADAMLMQNWSNVLKVLEHINMPMKKDLNVNCIRVRRWNGNGFASYYRQTIILSSYLDIYQRHAYMKSRNYAGRVEIIHQTDEEKGTINQIAVKSEVNIWLYLESNDPTERRNFFIKNIMPSLTKLKQVLLYVPDYSEYISLLYHLKNQGGVEFSTLNEYMIDEHQGKTSEARAAFYEQRRSAIIMTERFHFNRRYLIKGIRNIIFYSLPDNPIFVPEVCNWMASQYQNPHVEETNSTPVITVLFDKAGISKMCRFIGTAKTQKLWNTKKLFSTIPIYGDEA